MSNINSPERPLKLSVLMITYNHENFIEQAVRSVMMQETNFEYELVIGEDCSTDRTREIALRLKEEFPNKIRLLLHDNNIGMIPNMIATYNACTGEYIALCEGDDYWTVPEKLQSQVDYLEVHPDCRVCFHAAQVSYEGEPNKIVIIKPSHEYMVTFENWLEQRGKRFNYIATATIVFRAVRLPLPDWYRQLQFAGDWPLILWLSHHGGTLAFLERSIPMSIYRRHNGGVSHHLTTKIFIRYYNDHTLVLDYINKNLHRHVYRRLYHICILIIRRCLDNNDRTLAYNYLKMALRYVDHTNSGEITLYLKLLFEANFPTLYSWTSHLKHFIFSNVSAGVKGLKQNRGKH